MLEATPAPASTTISCLPLAASFLTVSGVAAMLVLVRYLATADRLQRRRNSVPLGNRRGDRLAELRRRRLAAEIGRARRRSIGQRRLDRAHDRRRRIGMAQ